MDSSKKLNIPSPLEIAILLTLLVLFLSTLTTEFGLLENLKFWGDGLWSLLSFMTQMSLILLGGFVVATSKPVNQALQSLATFPKTPLQVYLSTFLVSALACWLNWGLGLVAGAFYAKEVSRQNSKAHFPLVVAISYMGFIFWHGGLSGSIPLVVGTPGNFSYKWLGRLMAFNETVFSALNFTIVLSLFVTIALLILYFAKRSINVKHVSFRDQSQNDVPPPSIEEPTIYAKTSYFLILLFCSVYLCLVLWKGEFSFGLNQVNFLLFACGVALHGGLSTYMQAVGRGMGQLAPILVQYPLYAGIMGIMIQSGLAIKISNFFVSISSETTYPLYMFLSAGVVNLFVPSGGGQWAVQAPVVIAGAMELGVPLEKAIMAVAWGDAWTNLAQPFWALPILAIVGLGLKDIIGYCLKALVVSGVVIGLCFLVI